MPHESVRLNVLGQVPKHDEIIHAGRSHVLAGRVQVKRHDTLLMPFEHPDKRGVLFDVH